MPRQFVGYLFADFRLAVGYIREVRVVVDILKLDSPYAVAGGLLDADGCIVRPS